MQFLERIAATLTQGSQPGAARPALPSRFAAPSAALRPAAPAQELTTDTAGDDHVDENQIPSSHATTETRDETAAEPPPPAARASLSGPARASSPAVVQSPARTPGAEAAHTPVLASPSANPRPLARIGAPTDRTETTPPRVVLQSTAPARPPKTSRLARVLPLSESTVASRPLAAADQHPIIHVTIDRIDVRAPAVAPSGKQSRRPRVAESSVSLSDYLGGRHTRGAAR